MIPIEYQVVGEEEYALKIRLDGNGGFVVESGTYATQEPRMGQVPADVERDLAEAIEALGAPRDRPMPEGASAFEARLTLGEAGHQSQHVFWEGELESDAALNRVVRLLERL